MHPKWNAYFFFLFTKMHRKAISFYVATKGDWVAVGSTQRGNCLPSSKTLNCICATISLLQTPRQAIKRQCRRMNEKYHKGDERTKLIDQGGSRGQRRHAFGAKRMHTCIALCTYPYRGDPQEGDKTRAKSRVWHTYLIAHATHTYTLTHYANHSKFIAGTFKSLEIKYEILLPPFSLPSSRTSYTRD